MEGKGRKKLLLGLLGKDKAGKLILIVGLCGILLLGLSSLSGKTRTACAVSSAPAEETEREYEERLEAGLTRIVCAITGEESPAVLITLESGVEHVYAADESFSSRQTGESAEQDRETTHVILKDSGGTQRGLTLTELQPKIKGVVIVSSCAGDPAVRERLTDAARTALGVSSARVCVTETG